LGGRYNSHSEFGSAFTYSFNPSYLINNRVKLFANYSTGFKAPTLSELYGQFGANDKLKPQESNSAEAGIQYVAPSNRVDIRATYFNRKIENAIVYGAMGYVNLDEQNDHGFEIEPTIRVNDKFFIRGFYAFVDGEVTTKTFVDKDTTFNNLIRRPKNSVGVNIGCQITKNFFASMNFKTFGARKDTFFDSNDFSTKSVNLSAYHLLDLYAEYKLAGGRIRLFFDAKNILDQDYAEVYGYNTLRFNLNTGVTFNL
jgi:vitamin B12 transporter